MAQLVARRLKELDMSVIAEQALRIAGQVHVALEVRPLEGDPDASELIVARYDLPPVRVRGYRRQVEAAVATIMKARAATAARDLIATDPVLSTRAMVAYADEAASRHVSHFIVDAVTRRHARNPI